MSVQLQMLEELAANHRLEIVYADLVAPGYLLRWFDGTGEILVKETDPLDEQIFTIAHELGHHFLGIGGFGENWSQEVEDRCDEFARDLLKKVMVGVEPSRVPSFLKVACR